MDYGYSLDDAVTAFDLTYCFSDVESALSEIDMTVSDLIEYFESSYTEADFEALFTTTECVYTVEA